MQSDFPKTMRHPAHSHAVIGPKVVDWRGRVSYGQSVPERYPNMLVHDIEQEDEARSRGYLPAGEAPAQPVGFSEYPLMMAHPEHIDSVPDEIVPQRMPDGSIVTTFVPGLPEKFPHIQAKDVDDEAAWAAKGYLRMGRSDVDASEASKASPYVPGATVSEYPKWVNRLDESGNPVLNDDGTPVLVLVRNDPKKPEKPAVQQYPKWIADLGVAVESEQEEAELRGAGFKPVVQPEATVVVTPRIEQAQFDELKAQLNELKAALAAALAQPEPKVDGRQARREREKMWKGE